MNNFFAVVAVFLVIFGVSEALLHYGRLTANTTRRVSHVLAGVMAAFLPRLLTKEQILMMAGLFFLGLIFSKRMKLLRSIHDVSRATIGEILFPVGVGLAALLFLPSERPLYELAILNLGLADAAANFAGSAIPSHRVIFDKTVIGSLTFLVVSFALSFVYLPLGPAIATAVTATYAEAASPHGWDNVTIILAVGLIGWLISLSHF